MAASWRTSSLLQAFNNPLKPSDELARHYPVAIVAAIEGYFRGRLAQLIDHGDPFRSNAIAAYPDVKLDGTLAKAIVTGSITLGEIITHPISLSSFENLVAAVTNISGQKNWLTLISKLVAKDLTSSKRGRLVMSNPEKTWELLNDVFRTRHILCHELASEFSPNKVETRDLLLHAQEFLRASAQWFAKLQNPDPEKTFQERRKASMKRLRDAEKNLEMVLNADREIFPDKNSSLLPSKTTAELKQRVKDLASFMNEAFTGITKGSDLKRLFVIEQIIAQSALLNGLADGLKHWMFAYEYLELERQMLERHKTLATDIEVS
ncbi:MAG TPA: hypothetical protein VL495_01575 [Edaphobacter sp.]|jgi:hypothetical protein|nr:hypothetical protein [Edaphobacter sp.]